MKLKTVASLLTAFLACASLNVRAQDNPMIAGAIANALATKNSADATTLAAQLRAMSRNQDIKQGLRPLVQFDGDNAIVVFAIEAPSGAPTVSYTTDGSTLNTQHHPTLMKLGEDGLYAAVTRINGAGKMPFATGVGLNVVYYLDGKPIDRKRPNGSPDDGHFEAYPHNPDNDVDPNAPKGKLTQQPRWKSTIFANTERDWWVYVPAQYTPDKPACVMIFQDGGGYKDTVSRVFDRLIAKGDMPVTVGIFINPGDLPRGVSAPGNRGERSYEYDTRSDLYPRFLLEEMLPEVEKTVKLRHDAASRAVAGLSSGSPAAFACVWYRPDQFSKVLSWIGSFTDLSPGETGYEGAHNYSFLIRRLKDDDPRTKIRVFLQDGGNDLDNPFGDWPLSNQEMARALNFKHIDYKFVFGGGNHSGTHGYAILPETLRWLWRQ